MLLIWWRNFERGARTWSLNNKDNFKKEKARGVVVNHASGLWG